VNLSDPVKLVSQLLDLPIVDKDGRWCGVVDDVEFDGSPGKETRVKALLVGPGAYTGRMPRWMLWLTHEIAGDRMVRVPAAEIAEIGAVVKLKSTAQKLKLGQAENEVRPWIPRVGAI
jgi:sporulation protein YlmC with PRC-barrel domain